MSPNLLLKIVREEKGIRQIFATDRFNSPNSLFHGEWERCDANSDFSETTTILSAQEKLWITRK